VEAEKNSRNVAEKANDYSGKEVIGTRVVKSLLCGQQTSLSAHNVVQPMEGRTPNK
jgi:hypothetical protein